MRRAIVWAVPTVIGAAITVVVYPNLDFLAPAGVNRVVAYSAALVTLPAPAAAVLSGYRLVRYVLLALWPAPVCVRANAGALTFQLGPFGVRRFDSAAIEATYPFEWADDETEGGFEAYLPQAEQFARLLPRLTHPHHPSPLNRTILDFCVGDEASIAAALRPAIETWRDRVDSLSEDSELSGVR